ncbi:DUF2612 domain-containing protein [Serratia rubidaea]|uniref:DUF2612 domain-containing protein n=1 Tax=Serratia rubidaea TaxID=61652 RepID=UPI0017851207|nr:DUF2612 domain-containing protein [Serratia rubidaea]MBD8451891.1 DUF2612 domain-containing protein [Serratia rubidaea]
MNKYTELIPSYHLSAPKFTETATAITDALIGSQAATDAVRNSFNIDTAVGAQLDIIGLWVGRGRRILAPIGDYFFSFDIPGLGFDEGTWKGRFDTGEGYIDLDDETYRTILRAKIGANNWDGTTETLPDILNAIYPNGDVAITFTDNQDMTMTITVTGENIPVLTKEVIRQGYLAVKPMGITVNYEVVGG